MRWILRSLAIAVAGFVLVAANPPAQAEELKGGMTTAQQQALVGLIAGKNVSGIADLAASLPASALADFATYLVDSNDAKLIADVLIKVNASGRIAGGNVASAVGVAIAKMPASVALSLGPAVVKQTTADPSVAVAVSFAIIYTSTNGDVRRAVQTAAVDAGVGSALTQVLTLNANGNAAFTFGSNSVPVPPPCTTSCSANPT